MSLAGLVAVAAASRLEVLLEPTGLHRSPPGPGVPCSRALSGRPTSSPLSHVRRDLGREEVLAGRREDVDHLRVFVEPRFVLDAARDHAEIACTTHALLGPETEFHPARQHHEDLLVRVAMRRSVSARFIDHQTIISWSPTRTRREILSATFSSGRCLSA